MEEGSATLGIARNIKDISHPEKERNIWRGDLPKGMMLVFVYAKEGYLIDAYYKCFHNESEIKPVKKNTDYQK